MVRMTHKSLPIALVLTALLTSFSEACIAQISAQQMAGYQGGTTRGQGSATHSAGLGVVPEDFIQLKLAPGFLLSVNVLDDTDFQGTFRIDQDGDITLPILGNLHVAGSTASQARIQLRKRLLDEQILKDPLVELTVLEYSAPQVTILGEVGSPGKYPLLAPHKLVDVLALAGGPTITAGNEVQITSHDDGSESTLVHYSKATNPGNVESVMVRPGDTVQVKRAGIVYVLGAVNRPGGYVMQEEGTLNLLQAMSLAYGPSQLAKTGKIYVLRQNPDGTAVYIALSYKEMTQGKHANFQLRATDIVYVPTSAIKATFATFQPIITAAAAAAIYTAPLH
jgi:polysaccharide export outer membrane protein